MKKLISWLLLTLILVAAAGAAWYLWRHPDETLTLSLPLSPEGSETAPEPAVAAPEETERYPIEALQPAPVADDTEAEPEGAPAPVAEAPPPLPPLDASDAEVQAELQPVLGEGVAVGELFNLKDALRRLVASVDGLSGDKVVEKIRLLKPVGGPFLVAGDEDEGTLHISRANYARYTSHVAALEGIDDDRALAFYVRFYPLIRQAYADLGYRHDFFNDHLVEAIDLLLGTPIPQGTLRLKRPHVLYTYADPELEALSAGQKMLLRIGPDNAERVKARLRRLRNHLVGAAPGN